MLNKRIFGNAAVKLARLQDTQFGIQIELQKAILKVQCQKHDLKAWYFVKVTILRYSIFVTVMSTKILININFARPYLEQFWIDSAIKKCVETTSFHMLEITLLKNRLLL